MEVSKKHTTLKVLLIIQTVGLLIYTIIAIQNDGANFLARALEFATSMTWMGQFTLDFQSYLILSALWVVWRNKFSINSIVVAMVAMILGIIVFAPYLLYLLSKEKGDLKRVLVGNR
ncbi:MAG: hypothetical protein ACMZ7B_08185 [Balneola sp.]